MKISDITEFFSLLKEEGKNVFKYPLIFSVSIILSVLITYEVVFWGYARQLDSLKAENILHQTEIGYLKQPHINMPPITEDPPKEENAKDRDQKKMAANDALSQDNHHTPAKALNLFDKCNHPSVPEQPITDYKLSQYIIEQNLRIDYCMFLLGHKSEFFSGKSPVLSNSSKIKLNDTRNFCDHVKKNKEYPTMKDVSTLIKEQAHTINVCRSMLEILE